MILWASLLACSGDGVFAPNFTGVYAENFHGLAEGASWTWTDTPEAEELADESELLRGRAEESAIVIRRGARYADGQDWGGLSFDVAEGITLKSWDLNGDQGQGPLLLAPAEIEQGATIDQGGWSCVATLYATQETFFGTFDSAMSLACEGNGPAGTWVFAEDLGLVYLSTGDLEISLVAPW